MPLPALTFRTSGVWGAGIGRNLMASEADTNIYNLGQAISTLEDNPPQANSITSITTDGLNMYVTLGDGTILGPFPLPVLEWRWRAAWTAFTIYAALDVFIVDGDGLYVVLVDHTSGASFNPAITAGNPPEPALQKLLGMNTSSFANVYDISPYYPGRPRDTTSAFIYELTALRDFTVPISGPQHYAKLDIPPSTTTLVFPIKHSGATIGTITFAVGSTTGVIAWSILVDEKVLKGDVFGIAQSAAVDPVAQGLSVSLACQLTIA